MNVQFPSLGQLEHELSTHPKLTHINQMEPTLIQEIAIQFQDKVFRKNSLDWDVRNVIAAHTCDFWWGCRGKHGFSNWDFLDIKRAIAEVLEEIAQKDTCSFDPFNH